MFGLPVFAPEHGGTAVDGRRPRRTGRRLLVAVLQPRPMAGAAGCDRPDGRRSGRHAAARSRVHFERHDGIHAVRLCRASPQPLPRRMGRRQPRPFERAPPCRAGGRDSDGVRSVDARPYRRHQRRRRRRFRMALVADSRGTASRRPEGRHYDPRHAGRHYDPGSESSRRSRASAPIDTPAAPAPVPPTTPPTCDN